MDYLKDEVNHFSNPPYCIIKPGYRASDPFPNHDQLEVKHMYSFKPFGDQRHQRSNSDMFKTTFRSTMQADAPHYRGSMSPYNVKHALVDPSHTFIHPPNHKTRREMDFTKYDWKKGRDTLSKDRQHFRRETFDIHGNMILRLPEQRDYFGEESDPVTTYR